MTNQPRSSMTPYWIFDLLEKGLPLDVYQYLECYHADLRYQYDAGGRNYVNDCSSGTPYFDSEDEAKEYIDNRAAVIQQRRATIELEVIEKPKGEKF